MVRTVARFAQLSGCVLVLVFALASCPPSGTAASLARPNPAPAALSASDALLYVSGYSNSIVAIYDLTQSGDPLVGTISSGINGPGGIALDKHGTLYVANYNGGTVTEYPFGATSPSVTLTDRLVTPTDVTVTPQGDVYVANRATPSGIVEYLAGQTTAHRYVTSSLLQKPEQVAFDGRLLLVSDDDAGVSRVDGSTVTSLGLQGLGAVTSGLAVDPRDGTLFVGDNSANVVHVFRFGNPNSTESLQVVNPNFLTIGTLYGTRFLFAPAPLTPYDVYFFKMHRDKPVSILKTVASYANGAALWPGSVR